MTLPEAISSATDAITVFSQAAHEYGINSPEAQGALSAVRNTIRVTLAPAITETLLRAANPN